MIVNRLSLIEERRVIDVKEHFLRKLYDIDKIVGLVPETLNTWQKLGEAIDHDANFYESSISDLSFKTKKRI